ncbi:hypothetical protein D3C81_1468320 [compost metagenome]
MLKCQCTLSDMAGHFRPFFDAAGDHLYIILHFMDRCSHFLRRCGRLFHACRQLLCGSRIIMCILAYVNGELLECLRIIQHLGRYCYQASGHLPQHCPCVEHRFGNRSGLILIFHQMLILLIVLQVQFSSPVNQLRQLNNRR